METIPFHIEEIEIFDDTHNKPLSHPYYRLHCPDWVNVLPITKDGRALLIKQMRAGNMQAVLECPGGVIDDGETDPAVAVHRELEEETGYRCGRLQHLASINPNPAIQDNTVHLYLALDCEPAANRELFPDENEDISIELTPVAKLDELVRNGKINSVIPCLTIQLAAKFIGN